MYIDEAQTDWLNAEPIGSVRSLVFFWILRACTNFHDKVGTEQGWHDYGYRNILQFVFKFGVFTRFQTDELRDIVGKIYNDPSFTSQIDLLPRGLAAQNILSTAATVSGDHLDGANRDRIALRERLSDLCLNISAGSTRDGLVAPRTLEALQTPGSENYFSTPIWENPSAELTDVLSSLLHGLEHGSNFGPFWCDWYRSFLDGEPLDWELQRRVAEIDFETWRSPPEVLNNEIAIVRTHFDLEKRIDDLEDHLWANADRRHGLGGNNPPEPIGDYFGAQAFEIISNPVRELKDEIAKDNPEPARLERIIESLVDALKIGLAWCLKKADLMVDSAIKWAIPFAGGYLTLNPEKLEAVIEYAKQLQALF